MTSPATTLALLRLDAVVGLKGRLDADGGLASVGITCALCHSSVDDSFAPGIGRRLDGWANRDLDPGLIISLAPDLSVFTTLLGVDEATVKLVLQSWGPGKFDASLLLDGKAFRPDGGAAAVLNRGRGTHSTGIWPGRFQPPYLDRLGLGFTLERPGR